MQTNELFDFAYVFDSLITKRVMERTERRGKKRELKNLFYPPRRSREGNKKCVEGKRKTWKDFYREHFTEVELYDEEKGENKETNNIKICWGKKMKQLVNMKNDKGYAET